MLHESQVVRDMPPHLAQLNRRLLVSGGPGAFSCVLGAVGGAPGAGAAFRQTPVQLVQLVRQGSRHSSDLSTETSSNFAVTPREFPVTPQHAQRGGLLAQQNLLDMPMVDTVSDPLSRLLGFR